MTWVKVGTAAASPTPWSWLGPETPARTLPGVRLGCGGEAGARPGVRRDRRVRERPGRRPVVLARTAHHQQVTGAEMERLGHPAAGAGSEQKPPPLPRRHRRHQRFHQHRANGVASAAGVAATARPGATTRTARRSGRANQARARPRTGRPALVGSAGRRKVGRVVSAGVKQRRLPGNRRDASAHAACAGPGPGRLATAGMSSPYAGRGAGCSTRARTRLAMNRAVRTGVPPRVNSVTSTTPRPVRTSTRRPARVAATS